MIGQEILNFGRSGQNSGGIQVGAAQESSVIRGSGRGDVEGLQFGENKFVDVVAALELGVDFGIDRIWERNAQARIEDAAGVVERDGGLAAAIHFDVAHIVDAGDAFIAGRKFDPARDVLNLPVGRARANHQLLLSAGLQRSRCGVDFKASDGAVGIGRRRSAGSDPFGDDAVFEGIGVEALAAAVRNRHGGLEQNETVRRLGE